MLVFEGQRLIAANRYGLELVGGSRERLGEARWEDFFAVGIGQLGGRGQLRRRDGLVLQTRLQPARARPAASPRQSRRPAASEPIFDAATTAALGRAVRLLDADVPVLVQGETGSGKEVFARATHSRSARAAQPFIAVNCAALPESLIESELFGYEEGAFTGARRHGSKGLLREADGGTLFLDEIGDTPISLQARLLRVLQEREVMPLGGVRAVPVDFALICATHRRLRDLLAEGGFRSDLYFRIAQYTVELPPLRSFADRQSLIRSLWAQLGGDVADIALSSECERRLAEYDWPGNYRQLAAVLRALFVLATPGQEVPLDALPPELREFDGRAGNFPSRRDPPDTAGHLQSITLEAMRRSVDACGGNVSHAAKRLGISRSTLYRRLFPAGADR